MAARTLAGFLEEATVRFGDREMLAFAPGPKVTARYSGAELRKQVEAAACWLAALGVSKGTHVGVLFTNRPEWIFYAFGAWVLGAVVVPLSTLWKTQELAFALRHADIEALIAMSAFRTRNFNADLAALLPELLPAPSDKPLFNPSFPNLRWVRFLPVLATPESMEHACGSTPGRNYVRALEERVTASDRAAIFFTSGTTAVPKAVVHCHEALLVSARRIALALGINEEDAWWGHMPLFWTGGFVLGLLATWSGGGRVVLHERVEPGEALLLLEEEGCTIMAGWHQAGALLEHPDFPTRHLRLRKGSAHSVAPQLLVQPHFAVGMYGLSETATCVAAARWDEPEEIRMLTCGKPLTGTEVKIVDPQTGTELPQRATGEICARGVTLMEGYYKVPVEETFDHEGFFHTGDLGFLDESGRLHFVGRLKDVIKTAGVNVAALEVEQVLQRHAAVESAHVVGVPHETRGENVAAFVILRAAASKEELTKFCQEQLASYKVPRYIFFVSNPEIPRTATGKVEKTALKAEARRRIEQQERQG